MSMVYWLMSGEALQRRLVREIREARTPLTVRTPQARDVKASPTPQPDANGVAEIHVEGVLTPTPDLMAQCYGEANTTYPDLIASLKAALEDENVREIVWKINSPGGSVDGYFALLEEIADARGVKPMSVLAGEAQSAAYGIAAAVGHITAASKTSSFGSVGVATTGFIQGGLCGEAVDMTNTDAPEKRPNIKTPEGKQVVVKYLDQIAAEFMGAIAAGRGVSPEVVAQNFGRGSSMLAGAARDAGLIDAIAERPKRADIRHTKHVARAQTPAYAHGEAMATPAQDPIVPVPVVAVVAAPAPAAPLPAVDAFAAERAELEQFRAERKAREAAEHAQLVADAAAYRAARALPALPPAVQPPSGTGVGPAAGVAQLSAIEQHEAAQIKDPAQRERFIARRLSRAARAAK